MNTILNHGFVSPYILFNFAGGSIDTVPPRYFMSFHQDRSVKEAASFELVLAYTPGVFGETNAENMHQMLLSSVNKPVYYIYGYRTPGGGVTTQDQAYVGQFTSYNEELTDTALIYRVSGIGYSVDVSTPNICVSNIIRNKKAEGSPVQPSKIAQEIVDGPARDLLLGFDIHIDNTDDLIDPNIISIEDGPFSEVFLGKRNTDGTAMVGGLVHYSSNTKFNPEAGTLESFNTKYNNCLTKVSNGISNSITADEEAAYKSMKDTITMPYICYFDNVIGSVGSSGKGSFYYVEKQTKQQSNVFVYNFGNSFIDSDVIDFSVSVDDIVAMASVQATNKISAGIDCDGNLVGSNYNIAKVADFTKNTYNTKSGFDESYWLSESMLANTLNFPYTATMTVVGQTTCNQLLDKIQVNVYVNGVPHVGLTGEYIIQKITDDLSESGFTTTFELFRPGRTVSQEDEYVATGNEGKAQETSKNLKDDYAMSGA